SPLLSTMNVQALPPVVSENAINEARSKRGVTATAARVSLRAQAVRRTNRRRMQRRKNRGRQADEHGDDAREEELLRTDLDRQLRDEIDLGIQGKRIHQQPATEPVAHGQPAKGSDAA